VTGPLHIAAAPAAGGALPCAACLAAAEGFLASALPAVDDPEGAALDADLPPVIDAHVHLFPPRLFAAVWRWFDRYGWPVRYRLHAEAVIDHLRSRGARHLVALIYAHKPGMARSLNAWMAELTRDRPDVTGFATVFPGEEGAAAILADAFDAGLGGVKLHCHVQRFSVDDPELDEVYALCSDRGRPMVIHAGREPRSPGYACDPYALCSADRVERVLTRHPRLRLCVPHLGIDEMAAYERLVERHDTLWLDTAMVLAGYLPTDEAACWRLLDARPDRVLYGSDFPIIPYAWDRELRRIAARRLPPDALAALLGGNAARWLDLSLAPAARGG
jgi:predicted TIM-barrel fold metal-dependent hydrolase